MTIRSTRPSPLMSAVRISLVPAPVANDCGATKLERVAPGAVVFNNTATKFDVTSVTIRSLSPSPLRSAAVTDCAEPASPSEILVGGREAGGPGEFAGIRELQRKRAVRLKQ